MFFRPKWEAQIEDVTEHGGLNREEVAGGGEYYVIARRFVNLYSSQ
jgi:hypothetical protein